MIMALLHWKMVDDSNSHYNTWQCLEVGYLESFRKDEDPNLIKPYGANSNENMSACRQARQEHETKDYISRAKTYGLAIRKCAYCGLQMPLLSCENYLYKGKYKDHTLYFCTDKHKHYYFSMIRKKEKVK